MLITLMHYMVRTLFSICVWVGHHFEHWLQPVYLNVNAVKRMLALDPDL